MAAVVIEQAPLTPLLIKQLFQMMKNRSGDHKDKPIFRAEHHGHLRDAIITIWELCEDLRHCEEKDLANWAYDQEGQKELDMILKFIKGDIIENNIAMQSAGMSLPGMQPTVLDDPSYHASRMADWCKNIALKALYEH